jgi:hypothetical protein
VAAPVPLAFAGSNNETFNVSQAFPWTANQWPLPPGSYFLSEARTAPGSIGVALRCDSRDGTLGVAWDAVDTQVILTWTQTEAAVANLSGVYPIDVLLTRPQGSGPPRVDQIGVGTVTFNPGVTR